MGGPPQDMNLSAEDCKKMQLFSNIYNFVLALSGGIVYTLISS